VGNPFCERVPGGPRWGTGPEALTVCACRLKRVWQKLSQGGSERHQRRPKAARGGGECGVSRLQKGEVRVAVGVGAAWRNAVT
jgi:hypothetical protein